MSPRSRKIVRLAAVLPLAAVLTGTLFVPFPTVEPGSSSRGHQTSGLLQQSGLPAKSPSASAPPAWTCSWRFGMACGTLMAFGVARACFRSETGKSAQNVGRSRVNFLTTRRATSLLMRERCDGHGFNKNDPEFDVTDSSNLVGESVTVEFKKRPTGIMRYSHGTDGKGAIVLEMQDKSRYPGDPKGQAAVGGVKKNYVIKSIGGQECLDWSFIDIMDLLDDYEFQPTDTKEAKDAWKVRERKYEAVELPVSVEFQECTVTVVEEDAVAEKIAGKWYPRGQPYTDEDLTAELERIKKECPVPSDYSGVVYSGPGCLDEAWIMAFMEQQKEGIILPKQMAYNIVIDIIRVLRKESTMSDIEVAPGSKITVCGDTHGQYWDTMNIFKLNGLPSASNPYIFNGDFVDRGSWAIENVFLIYALKLMVPDHMYLTRGNHEFIEANLIYGFTGECIKKYDEQLFDLFSESFRVLPLCHLIGKSVLCTHGGLPGPNPRLYIPGMSHDPSDAIPANTQTVTLAQIRAVDRETELQSASYKAAVDMVDENDEESMKPSTVPDERIVIDMIWADPRGTEGYGPSYRKTRGIFMFGPDVTDKFCAENGLQFCIRSHEVKEFGWKQDHPKLYTVFSAPDYMDTGGNKGAFLTLTNDNGTFTVTPTEFEKTEHPDVPPMVWQSVLADEFPHLTKKMVKKKGPVYDSNGMLVEMSKQELEDAQNQWVEEDEEGDIDGVAPGMSLKDKASM